MKFPFNLLFLFFAFFFSSIQSFAQTTELWGMIPGGVERNGLIFKLDSNGNNFTKMEEFAIINEGSNFNGSLIWASNGKIYGFSDNGGIHLGGTLFEFDPLTNEYTKKHDFDRMITGGWLWGSPMQASNGKLYGLSNRGGVNDFGVLFEYDLVADTLIKKVDFDGISNGSNPYSYLIEGSNGKIYGMTSRGGVNNDGVIFEYDLNLDTFVVKHHFSSVISGSGPRGGLLEVSNGIFYGLTISGGIYDDGVLFVYDLANDTLIKKADFKSSENGRNPSSSLIKASNGKLYGTTLGGGQNQQGTLFEFDPFLDTLIVRHHFIPSISGLPAIWPLVEAANGKLYGVTFSGGRNSDGVLYEYNPSTNLFKATITFNQNTNGAQPAGALLRAPNGKLYGRTSVGGDNGRGHLFEFNPLTDSLIEKINFFVSPYGDGASGNLVQSRNGKLYGITVFGGKYGRGVIFEYNPTNNQRKVVKNMPKDFYYNTDRASLMEASDGNFYGLLSKGGINGHGALIVYNTQLDSILLLKSFFMSGGIGKYPYGPLLEASDGKFYGMTQKGGADDIGVLFQYDKTTDRLVRKIEFSSSDQKNASPTGSLIQASNGKIYGLFRFGSNGFGSIFEYDAVNNVIIPRGNFYGSHNGAYPRGNLVEAPNGMLFGLTERGGRLGWGVIFQFNPQTNSLTKKIDFDDSSSGKYPFGSLENGLNGKLYGLSTEGGAHNLGVIFEYNPLSNTMIKKFDFDGVNGRKPISNLLKVTLCDPVYDTITETACNFYDLPSGKNRIFGEGFFLVQDTLSSHCSGDSILSIHLQIIRSDTVSQIITACDSYTWIDGITYTASNNTPTFTFINSLGCDSVIKLNLTITNSSNGIDVISACDSFIWIDNIIYTSSNNTATHTLTNIAGCDSVLTLNLSIYKIDTSLSIRNDSLFANQINGLYQWFNCDEGFSLISGATKRAFFPEDDGNYACEITLNDCIDTTACYRLLLDKTCSIVFPNVFTPNGDQVNDFFLPNYQCDFQNFQLKIFNRWGQLVFSVKSPKESWDGSVSGRKAISGNYFYVLNYSPQGSSINKTIRGSFVLMD